MTWYRVYKTFRGGRSPIGYFSVPKYSNKDRVKGEACGWAENTPGGENYGWEVYWSRIKKPSKKWLKQEIENFLAIIDDYKKTVEEYQNIYDKL